MSHDTPRQSPGPDTPVSVLLPAYNAQRYLEEAVRSVLAQTHTQFELILIDDGSTDSTLSIMQSLAAADDRIRILSHENMGMGRSLNDAMQKAAHDWIVRMDADDVMPPHRIESQLRFLADNPHLVVASTLVKYIDGTGRMIGQGVSDYVTHQRVREACEKNVIVGFHHPAVIMRKDVALGVGGYRSEFWPCDDQDLWNRILEKHPDGVIVQNEYLMHYRIHNGSACVGSARLVQQKLAWVEACIGARRSGKPEPTWEEFMRLARSGGAFKRMNRARQEWARAFFKAASAHYSNRRRFSFVLALSIAGLLEPTYVIHRIVPQLRGS